MNPTHVSLETIADWNNLASATWRASAGKRGRYEVRSFLDNLLPNLSELRRTLLDGTVRIGQGRTFCIRDPKPRLITAACFRERVLQHALMWHVGPLLERALVADTFACLTGRGTAAAAECTQHHVRRFPWYAKMDVRKYFASIDHDVLRKLLRRRLKGAGVLGLLDRIIDAYGDGNGRGLPIGALTSQWFANYYLGPLDRFLLEQRRVAGMVRYMDDFVFWGATRDEVRSCAESVDEFLNQTLKLESRPPTLFNRSSHGVPVCGYRVFPGTIHLSRTRQDRFAQALTRWESEWLSGRISSLELQRGIDATLGMTVDADARNWIGECVRRRSLSDEIDRLDAISLRISHDDE